MKTIKIISAITVVLISMSCGNRNGAFDATGTFEATEVIVSAEATGRLIAFNAEEGLTLKANQQIGFIDSTQLYLRKLQLLENIRAVESKRPDISTQIAALEAQIASAQTEKLRVENLLKANAANQKQLDDVNTQLSVSQKQLDAQRSTLSKTSTGVGGESEALRIQVVQLEDQLQKCKVTSPINGILLVKYAEQGEFVPTGKALFKIADVEHMSLRAYITSGQLSQIKLGQKVKVFIDYGDKDRKEYSGTIAWISNKAEFTPKTIQTKDERANLVYAVKIAVQNDGLIKIGMYGEVLITN